MLVNFTRSEISVVLRALRSLLALGRDSSEHDYQITAQAVTKLERAEHLLREKST